MTGSNIDDYISWVKPLIGLPLVYQNSAVDMLMLQFGAWHTVTDKKNRSREVGEWALHLQCPWRFVKDGRILLASLDYYDDSETGDSYTYAPNSGRMSLYEKNSIEVDQIIADEHPVVRDIVCYGCGSFMLLMDNGMEFTVFPVSSSNTPDDESWRLLQAWKDSPHMIYPFGLSQ